jgi:predicted Zn finger-like uncharacterized protein
MALATRCPHCQTTFRVAHDQLKLRAGLVRCGACKQIFNGIEHLLPPDEAERRAEQRTEQRVVVPSSEPVVSRAPVVDRADIPDEENNEIFPVEPVSSEIEDREVKTAEASEADMHEAAPPPPSAEPAEPAQPDAEVDPLQRMTLMDFSYAEDESAANGAAKEQPPTDETAETADAAVPDPLEEAIADLQRKPLRSTKKPPKKRRWGDKEESAASSLEEPSFVKQGRRRQRIGRALRIFLRVGTFVLLVGLLMQGAYVFRDQIAARFPEAKPILVQGCAILRCQVGLPAQIEAVSIESSELQTLAPGKNSFGLTALLRNHSATAQAWPSIELTLNDADEKAIARRVFMPRDYLDPAQDFATGFAPESEQSVKLFFELSELKASGYRVYLFYP